MKTLDEQNEGDGESDGNGKEESVCERYLRKLEKEHGRHYRELLSKLQEKEQKRLEMSKRDKLKHKEKMRIRRRKKK